MLNESEDRAGCAGILSTKVAQWIKMTNSEADQDDRGGRQMAVAGGGGRGMLQKGTAALSPSERLHGRPMILPSRGTTITRKRSTRRALAPCTMEMREGVLRKRTAALSRSERVRVRSMILPSRGTAQSKYPAEGRSRPNECRRSADYRRQCSFRRGGAVYDRHVAAIWRLGAEYRGVSRKQQPGSWGRVF